MTDLGDSVQAYADAARTFATYPKLAHGLPLYPALGICGEIGEFIAATDDRKRMLEAGDILWSIMAAAHDLGLGALWLTGAANWDDMLTPEWKSDATWQDALVVNGARFADLVKKAWHGSTVVPFEAASVALQNMLLALRECCNAHGITLGQVAQANIDKLTSRRERGVIVGHGDDR